jgi:NitT/TauT family transport system ATP-binding protein
MASETTEIDILCDRVSHTFDTASAPLSVLRDLSFEVRRGESLVIIGPSGCGKTTLLRLLLGLEQPSSGRIERNTRRVDEGIAFIPQSAQMLPWRTALQNAALGLELRGELNRAAVDGVLAEFDRFNLRGFEAHSWHHLSGGMRQKVTLISALARRPSILFCDEPFSAIDFVSRLGLLTEFKSRCTGLGLTLIMVTHNLEEAIFLADRIIVLSRGPAEILEIFPVTLGEEGVDAVKCRNGDHFKDLFHRIWKRLE